MTADRNPDQAEAAREAVRHYIFESARLIVKVEAIKIKVVELNEQMTADIRAKCGDLSFFEKGQVFAEFANQIAGLERAHIHAWTYPLVQVLQDRRIKLLRTMPYDEFLRSPE